MFASFAARDLFVPPKKKNQHARFLIRPVRAHYSRPSQKESRVDAAMASPSPAMPVVKSDVDATYAAKFYERTGIIYTGGSGTSTLLSVLR